MTSSFNNNQLIKYLTQLSTSVKITYYLLLITYYLLLITYYLLLITYYLLPDIIPIVNFRQTGVLHVKNNRVF